MIGRLLRNPALVVLGAIVLLGLIALNWAMGVIIDQRGWGFEGAPSEEELWQMRMTIIAQQVPSWAVLTAVIALLGMLLVGSASRRPPEPQPSEPPAR